MRLGGIAVLPLPHNDGFLPDRNIVFWPYSKIKDVRFELFDDMVMLYGRSMEDAFKVGMHNSHGWIAHVMGNGLFVKRFATEQEGRYPDLGCNVEAYVRDTCLELETLGTLKTLKPAESVTYNESWEVIAGEYPTTLEGARTISKQLSLH